VSEGDTLSAQKAIAFEKSISARYNAQQVCPSPLLFSTYINCVFRKAGISYRILVVPRARQVHQSLLTTPASTLVSLFSCIRHISLDPFLFSDGRCPDALILNGPGTCLMLCVAVYVNKVGWSRCLDLQPLTAGTSSLDCQHPPSSTSNRLPGYGRFR